MALPLAAATYGFVNHRDRAGALRGLAEAGFELVELTASPPHVDLTDFTRADVRAVRRELDQHGLRCVATNAVELNPISPNAGLAAIAFRQYRAAIELASDLGAESVVMITGRANPLIRAADDVAKGRLRAQLERLLPVARALDVTLTLEPVPFGFMQTGAEVAAFIRELGSDDLGITVDCANLLFAGEDPVAALRAAAGRVALVHASDTWRTRFAHTRVGDADVDFAAFAAALREIDYRGPTVYELVDGDDPAPRLAADRARLAELGWS